MSLLILQIKEFLTIAGIFTISFLLIPFMPEEIWWLRTTLIVSMFFYFLAKIHEKSKVHLGKALNGIGIGVMASAIAVIYYTNSFVLSLGILVLGFLIAYLGNILRYS